MGVIYIMWLRELKRYVRSRAQIVASLAQPTLYLLALGFGLSPIFEKAGQGNYIQVVAPGVIAMAVLFSSIFSGLGMLFDRQFGFLKETLVAPVSRFQIMAGRTLGSATVAVLQGLLIFVVCTIAGFRLRDWRMAPLAVLVILLVAIVFAALGTAVGSLIKDMQGFQFTMNFLVMPLFFLSGALYPLAHLPLALTIITRIDPLSYGVDGIRGTLAGLWTFGLPFDLFALSLVAAVFLSLGAYFFSKIEA